MKKYKPKSKEVFKEMGKEAKKFAINSAQFLGYSISGIATSIILPFIMPYTKRYFKNVFEGNLFDSKEINEAKKIGYKTGSILGLGLAGLFVKASVYNFGEWDHSNLTTFAITNFLSGTYLWYGNTKNKLIKQSKESNLEKISKKRG